MTPLAKDISDVGHSSFDDIKDNPDDTTAAGSGCDVSSSPLDSTPPFIDRDSSPQPSSVSPRSSVSSDDHSETESDIFFNPPATMRTPDDEYITPLVSSFSSLQLSLGQSRLPVRKNPLPRLYYPLGETISEDVGSSDNDSTILVPRNFAISIRQVQRMQTELDKRTSELENELSMVKAQLAASVNTSKALLLKTQETIIKERRSMDQLQEGTVDMIQSLDQKFSKTQLAVATLQTQRLADNQAMERMANNVAEVIAIQEEMGCRLQRLSECEEDIHLTAERTKGMVVGLGDIAGCAEPARTLDQELEQAEPYESGFSEFKSRDAPESHDSPDAPDAPDVPDVPDAPGALETPVVPDVPDALAPVHVPVAPGGLNPSDAVHAASSTDVAPNYSVSLRTVAPDNSKAPDARNKTLIPPPMSNVAQCVSEQAAIALAENSGK